jgi:hypothetical protein
MLLLESDQNAVWFGFIILLRKLAKNNNEQNEREATQCSRQLYTNKMPQPIGGKRLPKYDPQTETTIDSCLWLGTIPGQPHTPTYPIPGFFYIVDI